MELTHNVFLKNVCRPVNITYSEFTDDYTPRTARVKGFIGDDGNSYGRYGIYGQCRTHSLLNSITRTKSYPTLSFVTKSGYKPIRKEIGKSNRCHDPLQLKSLRKNQSALISKTLKKDPKLIRRQSRQYELNSVKNAITKRKKLGIKVRRRKRPKSCPGYSGTTQRSIAMKTEIKKQSKEKERKCIMKNAVIDPFVDNNYTPTYHNKKHKKLFHSLSTSNLKHLQDLKKSDSLYDDLISIRKKINHDQINNLLKTNNNKINKKFQFQTTNNCLYNSRNKKVLSFLCDKDKQENIHKHKISNIIQNKERLNKYISEIENRISSSNDANLNSIQGLRLRYDDNIKKQTDHAYWQRWKARKSAFGHFSPTKKRQKSVSKPRKFWTRQVSLI